MASANNWEDIRRLAADLQRIQLGQTAKKLSDQNCIEVVAKLIDLGLVDLVFTVDGKEYLTKEYLNTQIRNECLANKGRISLVDLSQALNIDYQRIENHCNEITKQDPGYLLSVGQLISREYLDSVCVEINEKLQEEGRLSLQSVTTAFDLSPKLIMDCAHEAVGTLIHGHQDRQDSSVLYTDAFVSRQQGIIRAALTACTRPTSISRLVAEHNIETSMFFGAFDRLLEQGVIRGQLNGGRTIERAVFVPDIYQQLVQAYAIEFYAQNLYIDYGQLRRLGISGDAATAAFLAKVVPDKQQRAEMIELDSCILSPALWSSIEDAVGEELRSTLYTEVSAHLQNINGDLNTAGNAAAAANKLIKQNVNRKASEEDRIHLVDEDWLYSEQLLSSCTRHLEPLMREKADSEAPTIMAKVKKASLAAPEPADSKPQKGGGKGKKGKKGKADKDDWDASPGQSRQSTAAAADAALFEFMGEQALVECMRAQSDSFEQCPDVVLQAIAERLLPRLNGEYRERVQNVILQSNTDDAQKAKRNHVSFQHEFTQLYHNICMFDAGAQLFDESVCEQLRQLLLRTHCTSACHMALSFIADGANVAAMTNKIRTETINALPNLQARDAFSNAYAQCGKSGVTSLDEWYDAMQQVAEPAVCALNLRVPDKRAKADLLAAYISEQRSLLKTTDDPATGLLVIALLLIARFCHQCVHATGKFVPNMVQLLQQHIQDDSLLAGLAETQAFVVKSVKNKNDDKIKLELEDSFHQLRDAVLEKVAAE